MSTKKSIKVVYEENRLLYAQRTPIQLREYDPKDVEIFMEKFFAKRKRQMKISKFFFLVSCLITFLIISGAIRMLNSIV